MSLVDNVIVRERRRVSQLDRAGIRSQFFERKPQKITEKSQKHGTKPLSAFQNGRIETSFDALTGGTADEAKVHFVKHIVHHLSDSRCFNLAILIHDAVHFLSP